MKTQTLFKVLLAAQIITSSAYSAEVLKFKEGCSPHDDINVVGVGDILLHAPLQYQATKHKLRFKSLWSGILPLIQQADIAYANLEGSVADNVVVGGKEKTGDRVGFVYDNEVYTSYPRFNYHDFLVTDIKESGFDVVSTSNNHSLDREQLGADKTIAVLRAAGLPYTGTKTSNPSPSETWYTTTKAKGRTLAWLACTYGTNGNRDYKHQVLNCFQDRELVLQTIRSLAANESIDGVIVTPHWGDEYQLKENSKQQKLGREIIEAGALAVIGTHAHVVQPWEKYTTKSGREGLIAYGTGNFVAGQAPIERRTSLMVSLSLTAKPGEKLQIRGAEFVPLLIKRGTISSTDVREKYLKSPESLAPESIAIWKNNFATENIMKSTRAESLQSMCDLLR
jgi:hypothetical protein